VGLHLYLLSSQRHQHRRRRQIIVGALMATWFSLTFRTWPVGYCFLNHDDGLSCGAAWGFVPGILKARLSVNEILTPS